MIARFRFGIHGRENATDVPCSFIYTPECCEHRNPTGRVFIFHSARTATVETAGNRIRVVKMGVIV